MGNTNLCHTPGFSPLAHSPFSTLSPLGETIHPILVTLEGGTWGSPGGNTFLPFFSSLAGVTHFLLFLFQAISFKEGSLGEVWDGPLEPGPQVGRLNSRDQYMEAHQSHIFQLLHSKNIDFFFYLWGMEAKDPI